MPGRLAGQRAVVTGGTSGIGFGIAQRFVAEGASVLVAGLTKDEVGRAEEALRQDTGAPVWGHVGELSLPDSGELLHAAARRCFGGVDILVNNAGGGVIAATASHTEETVQRTMDNNLWTTVRCTLAVLPDMVSAGYGRIVNVGAESVRNGLDGHAVYNAAKGGVHALAVGLAREYAKTGVTVNVVAPAFTLTPELEQASREGRLTEHLLGSMKRAQELIPMGRPARVEEIAAAVLFLASPEASFITGQVLSVNGGSSMG
jgi:2,3-dihydroxy-2,3-dihydro-p-cumate dehydrogenase